MIHKLKKDNKTRLALVFFFLLVLARPVSTIAATTPSLGASASYGVLASTYTNTSLTTINGDVGFTTPPATAPLGAHTNYGSGAPYATAGINQASVLATLNSAACDFTFGSATDLSLLSQPLVPGVYCVTGAQSIGTGGISLITGTYIFRSTGALTTVANSSVVGGSACNVFWTPTATTLGANSTFLGNDIDPSGITVGAGANWVGRALAFGGTVTTDTNAITAPTCASNPPALATLHVIKNVVNTNGGTAISSSFDLHVKLSGTDVAGSPAPGTTTPGTLYALGANTYVVSESANAGYSAAFGGDCNVSGSVTLATGDNKICTITNTDIPPIAAASINDAPASSGQSRSGSRRDVSNVSSLPVTTTSATTDTPQGMVLGASTSTVLVPGFPNTGFPPETKSIPWNNALIDSSIILTSVALLIGLRKYTI